MVRKISQPPGGLTKISYFLVVWVYSGFIFKISQSGLDLCRLHKCALECYMSGYILTKSGLGLLYFISKWFGQTTKTILGFLSGVTHTIAAKPHVMVSSDSSPGLEPAYTFGYLTTFPRVCGDFQRLTACKNRKYCACISIVYTVPPSGLNFHEKPEWFETFIQTLVVWRTYKQILRLTVIHWLIHIFYKKFMQTYKHNLLKDSEHNARPHC